TGSAKFRVSPRGTVSLSSSGGIDGTKLVYQFRPTHSNNANLELYDLATRTRSDLPDAVNSRRWECCAAISGDWIVFTRVAFLGSPGPLRTIYLYNRTTGERRLIAQARTPVRVQKGTIAGNWLVWTKCT